MGSFANSAFSIILGWIRSAVSGLWQMVFAAEDNNLFTWIGEHWLALVIVLCAACTLVDVIIHLIRWRPMQVWASFFRRLRGKNEPAEEMQEQPMHTATVRREWYYPDGTARTEEVRMSEEEAYSQQPEWVQPAGHGYGRPSSMDMSQRYVQSFARPEEARVHPGVANKSLEYEDYPVAPLPGMMQEELPVPEPEAAAEEVAAEEEPIQISRSKRVLQRMAKLPRNFGLADEDDELQLRFQPAPPAVDKEQAYHTPVYPPSWRPPTDLHQEEHP